jgi:hypothetical protein
MGTRWAYAGLLAALPVVALIHRNRAESPVTWASVAASDIPRSIQREHQEIHRLLVRATRESGEVGEAARALAEVLLPHFAREEQIALPPLGALRPLAEHARLTRDLLAILPLTDSLEAELPAMLDEHRVIRVAVERLREAARSARRAEVQELAERLAQHALMEEEVMYPAAVVVGEMMRLRAGREAAPLPCLGGQADGRNHRGANGV